MEQYISKSALVAEIERKIDEINQFGEKASYEVGLVDAYKIILSFLNTLKVKEVGTDIPNIDDLLEEDGIDPDSKEAKIFKESYYSALEKLKEKIV